MVLFSWLIISIVALALVAAVFLWALRRPVQKMATPPPPQTDTEFAAEIFPKFVPPPPPAPQAYTPELPRCYGEDRLALLARDPYWLFAYWEISATKQEEFSAKYGPEAWRTSRPVLRLYDVTGIEFQGNNANTYVDIAVNDEADNWYIEVGQPCRTFCVDLGRVLNTGQFVTLLRSNLASTPRASLSECFDEEWMWLEGIYQSLLRYQFGLSSPLILEEVAARMGREFVPIGIFSPAGISSPVNLSPKSVSEKGF